MNSLNPLERDRVFPLCGGAIERPRLRAPRLGAAPLATSGLVMGNRAFMRAWAARRAARTLETGAHATPKN